MIKSDTRHTAIEVTKSFVKTVSAATGKEMDFFKILWAVHWAIDYYGLEKTRDTLVEILLSPGFEPENTATLLRDKLFSEKIEADVLGEWFERAMSA